MKKIILLIPVFFLLFSCGEKKPDYDAIAKELCDCMTPMVELNARIENALAKNDSLDMQAILLEAEELEAKSITCTEAIEAKLGETGEDDILEANKALKKVCPDVAKILEEAGY